MFYCEERSFKIALASGFAGVGVTVAASVATFKTHFGMSFALACLALILLAACIGETFALKAAERSTPVSGRRMVKGWHFPPPL